MYLEAATRDHAATLLYEGLAHFQNQVRFPCLENISLSVYILVEYGILTMEGVKATRDMYIHPLQLIG